MKWEETNFNGFGMRDSKSLLIVNSSNHLLKDIIKKEANPCNKTLTVLTKNPLPSDIELPINNVIYYSPGLRFNKEYYQKEFSHLAFDEVVIIYNNPDGRNYDNVREMALSVKKAKVFSYNVSLQKKRIYFNFPLSKWLKKLFSSSFISPIKYALDISFG